MFGVKKVVNVTLTEKAFRKTAGKLVIKLRSLDMPEMNECADKLEKQIKEADVPTISATLAEVTSILAKKKEPEKA